jgi:NADH dehydrogenase [ubiquinone] 1 alpha subcomplex assembly factor 7
VDAALYDEHDGFFSRRGGAGRSGSDFVTSPEIGTLFGALAARALDRWWRALGEPDPFIVVEAGAGRGRLAADVLRAAPSCAPALRYVMVERSAALREAQRELLALEPYEDAFGPAARDDPDEAPHPVPGVGPIVSALPELPAVAIRDGVVLANELLDNLPCRIVERTTAGWSEVRVGVDDHSDFVEVVVPAFSELQAEAERVAAGSAVDPGARLPVPTGAQEWFAACGRALRRGRLLVVDYADTAASLARRGQGEWLRTYRAHERGGPPLRAPGTQDITADVPAEFLVSVAARNGFQLVEAPSQRDWLESLGIDELVADARHRWRERAAIGDLEALQSRSWITEADALADPNGLGGHAVFVFERAGAS